MNANRATLILRVWRSGQEIETLIFYNSKELSDISHAGKVVLPGKDLEVLCENVNSELSRIGQADHSPARLLADFKRAGRELFDKLFDEKTKYHLKNNNANYLIFAVDKELMLVPWELLYDEKEFLCLRYATGIVSNPGQNQFGTGERRRSGLFKALVTAPSSAYMGLTYDEGVAVANKLYLRRGAIDTLLKVVAMDAGFIKDNIKKFDIIHFLGHMEYNVYDDSRSGWLFGNGMLSPRDIYLLGEKKIFPYFIFSGATQYGKKEEWPLKSMCRPERLMMLNAFRAAGNTHCIEMFWRISDEARLLFVSEFYDVIVKDFTIGEAIRHARLKVIETYGKASLFWAAYNLYGNPAISMFEREMPISEAADAKSAGSAEPFSVTQRRRDFKTIILVSCLALSLLFAAKFVINLLVASEILSPSIKVNPQPISSIYKEALLSRKKAIKELVDARSGEMGQDAGSDLRTIENMSQTIAKTQRKMAVSGGPERDKTNADLYNDIFTLQGECYFDLLMKLTIKGISRPEAFRHMPPGSFAAEYRKYYTKANIYFSTGKHKKAVEFADKARIIAEKSGNFECVSAASMLMAYMNAEDNRVGNALNIMSENKKKFAKTGYARGLADASFGIGIASSLPGKFKNERSVDILRETAKRYLSINDLKGAMECHLILGYLYLSNDSYDDAVKDLVKALDIALKTNDGRMKGLIYKSLADLELARNRYSPADAFYKKALTLTSLINNRINKLARVDILYKLALLEMECGDRKSAAIYYQRLKIFNGTSGSPKFTRPYGSISRIIQYIILNKGAIDKGKVYYDISGVYFRLGYYNNNKGRL